MQFDEHGSKQAFYSGLFGLYYKKLSLDEKGYLKDHFILLLSHGLGGNDERNEFLLYSLSLPKSCQDRVLQAGTLCVPYFNQEYSIGVKDTFSDPWVEPPSKENLQTINPEQYRDYAEIFEATLERVSYRGKIQYPVFMSLTFKGMLSSFFTQIDNIFHPKDAEKYKVFLILIEIAKNLGKGMPEGLIRPITSFGSRYEGEAYRGFAEAFEKYFRLPEACSPREIAFIMRSILEGKPLQNAQLYFLPNLIAAWFISESARNNVSTLSGLILLDLIESGVHLIDDDKNDLYSWKHVLIHPKKPKQSMTKVEIRDLYGDPIDLACFDGVHPMAHADSIRDGTTTLGEKQKLSAVRQKEGHLIIHWLDEKIKKHNKDLAHYVVVARPGSDSTPTQRCCLLSRDATSYKEIDRLFSSKKEASRIKSDKHLHKKWQLLHTIIIPHLKERLSSLKNLLDLGQSVVVMPHEADKTIFTPVVSPIEIKEGSSSDLSAALLHIPSVAIELGQLPPPPMTTQADGIAITSPKLTERVSKEPSDTSDKDKPILPPHVPISP